MVKIIRDKDKKKAFNKAVEGLFIERGCKVAIKPNLSIQRREACTDFELVSYLVDYLMEFTPGRIFIVESDTYMRSVRETYTALGYDTLPAELINLSEEHSKTIWPENTSFFKAFSYPSILEDIDCLISFAKLKTHILTGYTGVLKNQFGLLPFPDKRMFHRHLDRVIVDLNLIFPCHFYILDGIFAMHNQGPLDGDVIELDLVLSGIDPVSVDHCACKAVGIPPEKITHLCLAEKSGLGTFNYEIEGEIPEIKGFNLPD